MVMSILENVKKYGSYKEVAPGEWAGPCPECGGAMRFRVFPDKNEGKCQSCDFILTPQGQGAGNTGFDRARMEQILKDTLSRICSSWNSAGWEWLKVNRADITAFIDRTENSIDSFFEKEDAPGLVKALSTMEEAYGRAWNHYSKRPPVIARCRKADGGDCVCCSECDIDKKGEDSE